MSIIVVLGLNNFGKEILRSQKNVAAAFGLRFPPVRNGAPLLCSGIRYLE